MAIDYQKLSKPQLVALVEQLNSQIATLTPVPEPEPMLIEAKDGTFGQISRVWKNPDGTVERWDWTYKKNGAVDTITCAIDGKTVKIITHDKNGDARC
jgi:hypothetical protein